MMVVGVMIYCLIKNKIVRCCAKDNPAHLVELGGNSSAKQAGLNQAQQGLQPSAPPALQLQCTNAPSQVDLETSLARLQLQYAALAARVTSQQEQKEVTQGAPGQGQAAPRPNQYPLV